MKKYRQLVESLPSKSVLFTFDNFCPPLAEHQQMVQFVKTLAAKQKADHVIYALRTEDIKNNPISGDRKLHYLNLAFPEIKFSLADSINECASTLKHRYKNITFVSFSNSICEESLNIPTIQVNVLDLKESKHQKVRRLAQKGLFEEFKKELPLTLRSIDARRLMNDVREGMGLEPIKEQIALPVDNLRESYFRGEIYNVGEIVESAGEQFEIIKRGTNYLLVKDQAGKIQSKWIHEVIQRNN